MLQLTQSNLSPGNCWQTAVACIVGVPVDLLPPQVEIEALPNKVLDGWGSYRNVLVGYLRAHFGCTYTELRRDAFGAVRVAGPFAPFHCAFGPSERTEQAIRDGLPHSNHAVVACDGAPYWDPHPTRAGLTEIEGWGVIGVEQHRPSGPMHDQGRGHEAYEAVFGCLCPYHNLAVIWDRLERLKQSGELEADG